jgi:diamine N-acetyltransferase
VTDRTPLGRFYYRAWAFSQRPEVVDWELNILIADPAERGKGYGTAAQALALEWLLTQATTHSVFAYTVTANVAEQRALEKIGLALIGLLPDPYYQVPLPARPSLLYALVRTNKDIP